ncbi:MAG: 1-acyl-sn-glycerol-3-phosphate acyltransferase [Parachlamydiales bacterium]
MDFDTLIGQWGDAPRLPAKYREAMEDFYTSYLRARKSRNLPPETMFPLFRQFIELVEEQCVRPYPFEPYHEHVREPIDYYTFGVEMIRGILDESTSAAFGLEYADKIAEQLQRGENVICLANHQTEGDPQVVSILLEKTHEPLGREMIWVAGDRVLIDPMAIPFSMGRNLLCVYSKKYLEIPPERKAEKQAHNQRAMLKLLELLTEGGKLVYVAPSGGRDRPNEAGEVVCAPFDPQAIEIFRLLGQKSGRATHFYPLALDTYKLLPPPKAHGEEKLERRYTESGTVHLAFGEEIDLDTFPGSDLPDKGERRKARADYCWNLVNQLYQAFPKS